LFRIAHNEAIDELRHTNQQHTEYLDEQALIAEVDVPLEDQELVAVALTVVLQLTPRPRSCVILKDVMSCSLAEISELLDARDFDAVREMLADEVWLALISRAKFRGVAEVGVYFEKYEQVDDWRLALGVVEGRIAILVDDPRDRSPHSAFFMLIAWDAGQVSGIRDYRYARYVLRVAAIDQL